MDTYTLYLLPGEEKLQIMRPEMRQFWYLMMQNDCSDNFSADHSSIFLPREHCNYHAAVDKRTPAHSKRQFPVEIFFDIDTYISLNVKLTIFSNLRTRFIIFCCFELYNFNKRIFF